MRALRRRTRAAAPSAAALGALLLFPACATTAEPGALFMLSATGTVTRVMERYIDRAITQAEEQRAAGILLRIDTPGGEIGAMKRVVGRVERSRVPVITWVGPTGAQAASAGTFIAMAGHIAAMAPNTTIGAAAPVTATGEDVKGALGKKVENDTVAFARGVAELRGRNADWAEQAVREAVSATPQQAVDQRVVDLVVPSVENLLAAVQGREVRLLNGDIVKLNVALGTRADAEPNLYERVLQIVSDPFVVSLLVIAGIVGIGAEFFMAGTFLPGTVGVIALLLAFLGLGTLLPGEAAVALLLVGLALLAMEFFVPSGGVLGAGAAVAIVLGLSIALGQVSTALTLRTILLIVLIVTGTVTLLGTAVFLVIARGYLARSEESGGRLL